MIDKTNTVSAVCARLKPF